jgi:hypothetical protein
VLESECDNVRTARRRFVASSPSRTVGVTVRDGGFEKGAGVEEVLRAGVASVLAFPLAVPDAVDAWFAPIFFVGCREG